jgi:hypothetical protein
MSQKEPGALKSHRGEIIPRPEALIDRVQELKVIVDA